MTFIKNKYYTIYYNIINNARSRKNIDNSYTEKHHIIPQSLGGNDHPDNLVLLTAREHFICHRLLTKITIGRDKAKMVFALNGMLSSNKFQSRHISQSKTYEKIRRDFATEMSILHSGKTLSSETRSKISNAKKGKISGMKGKTHTKETKEILSNHAKNNYDILFSPDTISKRRQSRSGYIHTDETKIKIGIGNKGKTQTVTDETKEKISQTLKEKYNNAEHHLTGKPSWNKGKSGYKCKSNIVTCPHCGKIGGSGGMRRFHFDHCTEK